MKCSNCNFENRADARFCKKCGQPLPAQPTPSATPPPPSDICPACGATAKPGARFCPRCGKPLAAPPPSPAQPLPMTATQPSMGPLPQPYGQPPIAPSQPKRRPSRWPLLAGGIVTFLCIVAIVAAAWFAFKYLDREEPPTPTTSPTVEPSPTVPPPTATPTPLPPPPTLSPEPTTEISPTLSFDAQVSIAASAPELRVGEILTVTVTVTNTGDVSFGHLRYQLVGEWKPHLEPAAETEETMIHEEPVPPDESAVATFVLWAVQEGEIRLEAYVMMDTHTDPPSGESRLSDEEIVVRVTP